MNLILNSVILCVICASIFNTPEANVIRIDESDLTDIQQKLLQIAFKLDEIKVKDKLRSQNLYRPLKLDRDDVKINQKPLSERFDNEIETPVFEISDTNDSDHPIDKFDEIKDVNMCMTVACNLGCVAQGNRYGRCIHGHCHCY